MRRVVESAYVENYQPMTSDYGPAPYRKILGNPNVQDYYPLDGDGVDAHADGSSPNVVLLGDAEFAPSEFDYPGYTDFRPGYQTVRLQGAGDAVEVVYDSETGTFPPDAQWISVEAMVFVEAYEPEDADANFLSLTTNRETRLRLSRNRWDENLYLRLNWGDTTDLPNPLPLREWLHLRLVKQPNSASVFIDGVEVLNVLDDGFADWLEPKNEVRFRIGDFFGRASDMIVKAGVGPLETIDPIKEIVPGAPVFEVQPSPRLDLGAHFTPQVTGPSSSDGLRYEWSGPDGIQFDPVNSLTPRITFTETGDFELYLTVTNQEGISRVERSFLSVRDLSGNQAPMVDAGPPEAVSIRDLWQARPSVSDDSLPEDTLDYSWNQVAGPATVTFSDRLAQSPEVTFARRGVYVLELVVDDSHRQSRDQVSIAVEDEIHELVPGIPFVADAETLAIYHFNGDFNDASGNNFHLTPEGEPTFSDNVAWMKAPSGQSVAFAALGQQLVANMPHTERGFTLEWRCYLTEFLAYSLDAVELVGYYQDFDARLAFYQHRWTQPRIAGFDLANDTAISSEALERYLPRNTWIDMAMRYDATGMAAIYINGVPIYDQATAMQTRADKPWALTLGNFEGYVDELRVSRGPREIPLANRAPLVAMETGGVLEEPGTVAQTLPAIVDDDPALVYSWSVVTGNSANVTFSDGTALDTEITFAKNGIYTIALTVSDGELATAVSTVWTVGMDTPPVIQAETRDATLPFGTPFVPQVMVVDDDWAGATELMTSWEVVQGDPAKVTFTDASQLQPTVTFAEAGDYTLILKVSDGVSVSDADFTINVLPKLLPPVIRNTEPQVSLRLDDRFTPALAVEGDGPIAYRWSVSLGAAAGVSISDATTLNPTIQFNQVGEYELTIEATARDDLATSTVQVVVLRNLLPPAIRNGQPMVSLRLAETFTSTLEIAGDGPFIYEWSVSRGQAAQVVFSDLAVLNPTITFGEVGEYEVTIEVMARDEVATSTVQVVVLRNLLPPVISNDHPTVSLQLDETFTSTLEVEGDGPFAYEWTVSRGQTDQVAFSDPMLLNPMITFTEIGEYELTLLASARGDHSTSTVQVSVLPVPTPLERWRSANFRAETLNDPNLQGSVWGDLADPDGDGRVNLLEAYAGTDPFEPNLGPFLRVQQIEGQLILQWPRATDPLGLSARVLTSMTLENFKPVEPDPSITVGANGREVEARLPVDQAKSFLMIRVSLDR